MSEKKIDTSAYPPLGRHPGWCSFCREHHTVVGPLVEGPDQVYICYRCTQSCAEMIAAECHRRGAKLPELPTSLDKQTKNQIESLVAQISELSRTETVPEQFYPAFLHRVVAALAAVGGAIWLLNPDGQLALKYHFNAETIGLRDVQQHDAKHNRLLQEVLFGGKGTFVSPHSVPDELLPVGQEWMGENPTDFLLVFGVLNGDDGIVGLVEVFQRPDTAPTTRRGYVRFLAQMCELANTFRGNRNGGT